MYSNVGNDMQNENTVEKTFLRGHQITDEAGYVEFDAVVPGWEVVASAVPPITAIRRTPHIHVKVFHEHKVVTTQLYFEDDFMDRLYAEVEPYMSNRTMTVPGLSGSYARLRNVDDNAFHFDQSTPMAVQAEGEGIFASAIIGVATLGTRGFLPFKR